MCARYPDLRFVMGIAGDRRMRARETILQRLTLPPERWFSFVHASAMVSPSARVGAGVVVMEQALVGPRCTIGDHVRLSAHVCIGHETVIAARAVIAPAATVSGRVRIGEGAYVGAAAAIAPDVTIGARAIVGIGAVVIDSVGAGAVVAGNPARPLRRK